MFPKSEKLNDVRTNEISLIKRGTGIMVNRYAKAFVKATHQIESSCSSCANSTTAVLVRSISIELLRTLVVPISKAHWSDQGSLWFLVLSKRVCNC